MAKARGGKLILFATQTLCVFLLFHLLYIELFTFKATPSQIKFAGRQILAEWKADLRTEVKKDDQHQSLQYLLTRLVEGEDRTKLETTGFACDNTSWSLVCITNNPVKIDMSTMHVHVRSSPNHKSATENTTTTTVVRPYAMQENPWVMNDITPVIITTTEPTQLTCDHNHKHPAVIFSSGGYTGNIFHEFNENLIPLFITSRITRNVFDNLNDSHPPSLLLISRQTTRKFLNQQEMVKMMEELGFRVIIASSADEMSNVEKFSHVINSCSVMVGAHGAGLANEMFLPDGAVMVQVRPLGFQWDVDSFYSEPAPGMGLKYLEYMMQPDESSLVDEYGLDHPILQDTASVAAEGGYDAARKMYLDKQDLRLNLSRFRETLIESLRLVGRYKDVANA
uniref:Glycosyltransferase AER61 n=1 Tax=Tanacetum cinerariifolium TaxID=118510 RepID=A0A699HNZ1_TANCI|nr:glycosyltransferase AER61 [Tanacetum cinerariifolium]